jgi:HSP20 family protein
VELAGVDPQAVDVRFSNGVLTVSGARASGFGADEEVEFYVRERFYGAFRRVITLPEGTNASQIAAEVDDGLVEITVRNGVSASRSTRIALTDRSAGPTARNVHGRE